jgi:anti-sigma factor RsiW
MSDTIHLGQELSEYLDGDLDARARAAVETHLRDCAECTALLDELRAVSMRARALEPEPPAADLWPGISARLDRRRGAILPLPRWLEGGAERWSFTLPQLAAAALVIALISGGSVWWALRSGAPTRNGAGTQLAQRTTPPAPSPVSGVRIHRRRTTLRRARRPHRHRRGRAARWT